MTNKLKLLVATSLVALVTTGCSTAPAPWAQTKNGGSSNKGVTHSHNGQVHTHALPSAGIHHSHKQGGGSNNTSTNNSQGGTPHSHDGTRHTHPLPNSGLNHSHGGGYGRADGGSNSGSSNDSYTDAYGGYGSSTYDNGYYDSEYGRYNDRNTGSSYDSSRDNYYDSSRSNDYSSSTNYSSSKYDGGDTYTVQRKDTVFEVMRQTGAYWKDIIRLNDLKAPKYEIYPGQRLKLPKDRS